MQTSFYFVPPSAIRWRISSLTREFERSLRSTEHILQFTNAFRQTNESHKSVSVGASRSSTIPSMLDALLVSTWLGSVGISCSISTALLLSTC